jgi:hypothetical protein
MREVPIGPLVARREQRARGVLTCTRCHLENPLDGFVRIKACRNGFYGACKACRARQKREYYAANPAERARQIERARRNQATRKAAV